MENREYRSGKSLATAAQRTCGINSSVHRMKNRSATQLFSYPFLMNMKRWIRHSSIKEVLRPHRTSHISSEASVPSKCRLYRGSDILSVLMLPADNASRKRSRYGHICNYGRSTCTSCCSAKCPSMPMCSVGRTNWVPRSDVLSCVFILLRFHTR